MEITEQERRHGLSNDRIWVRRENNENKDGDRGEELSAERKPELGCLGSSLARLLPVHLKARPLIDFTSWSHLADLRTCQKNQTLTASENLL